MTDIKPGFYRIKGCRAAHKGRVEVCLLSASVNVWGLSLWGYPGEKPTWAYRTLGISLEEALERWPIENWQPDTNGALELNDEEGEEE